MNWSKRRLTPLLQLELGRGCPYEWPFSEENDLGAGPGLLSCRRVASPQPHGARGVHRCAKQLLSQDGRARENPGRARTEWGVVGGRIQENLPENPARPRPPLTHPPAEAPPLPTDKGGACTEATCLWGAWPRGAKAIPLRLKVLSSFACL